MFRRGGSTKKRKRVNQGLSIGEAELMQNADGSKRRPEKEYVIAKKGVPVKLGKRKVLVGGRMQKDGRTEKQIMQQSFSKDEFAAAAEDGVLEEGTEKMVDDSEESTEKKITSDHATDSAEEEIEEMIDDSYNQYTRFEDDLDLPKWFIEDEKRHFPPSKPLTYVDIFRNSLARWREIKDLPEKSSEARDCKRKMDAAIRLIDKMDKKA